MHVHVTKLSLLCILYGSLIHLTSGMFLELIKKKMKTSNYMYFCSVKILTSSRNAFGFAVFTSNVVAL